MVLVLVDTGEVFIVDVFPFLSCGRLKNIVCVSTEEGGSGDCVVEAKQQVDDRFCTGKFVVSGMLKTSSRVRETCGGEESKARKPKGGRGGKVQSLLVLLLLYGGL